MIESLLPPNVLARDLNSWVTTAKNVNILNQRNYVNARVSNGSEMSLNQVMRWVEIIIGRADENSINGLHPTQMGAKGTAPGNFVATL